MVKTRQIGTQPTGLSADLTAYSFLKRGFLCVACKQARIQEKCISSISYLLALAVEVHTFAVDVQPLRTIIPSTSYDMLDKCNMR